MCSLESGWPEIESSDSGIAPHLLWRPVRSRRPVKVRGKRRQVGSVLSRPVVPITAAGLRGEQPLVNRTMSRVHYKLTQATTLIYAIGAGITAAAGTRLALQSFLVKGFGLYSFQLPDHYRDRHCYLP